MWSSLLFYGGLFVAFGFLTGSLIWMGLVFRRGLQQRAEPTTSAPAQASQTNGKPQRPGFSSAPQQALHTTKLGPAATAKPAWSAEGQLAKQPATQVTPSMAPRTKPATNLLNFPR